MDKQALIDKAVEANEGIFPGEGDSFRFSIIGICIYREEFELRAKELGWINGYKCGVEYPTNGKKPELADDTVVYYETKCGHSATTSMEWLDFAIGQSNEIKSFRIVGERTKDLSDVIFAVSDAISVAVDVGAMTEAIELQKINWDLLAKNHGVGIGQRELQANPDNSWHERGELPPVGVECEYSIAGLPRKTCTFVGINSRGSMVVEDCHGQYKSYHAHQIKLHPIKTQREKFVEAALTAADKFKPECDITFAQALYEAGFKAPDEKNRS